MVRNTRTTWEFVRSLFNHIFRENRSKCNCLMWDNLVIFREKYIPRFSCCEGYYLKISVGFVSHVCFIIMPLPTSVWTSLSSIMSFWFIYFHGNSRVMMACSYLLWSADISALCWICYLISEGLVICGRLHWNWEYRTCCGLSIEDVQPVYPGHWSVTIKYHVILTWRYLLFKWSNVSHYSQQVKL